MRLPVRAVKHGHSGAALGSPRHPEYHAAGFRMRLPIGTAALLSLLLSVAAPAAAQTSDRVEVSASAGYRLGGDFYEIASRRPVDNDGAPSFGIAVNIPFTRDTQIEALVTHQQARVAVPGGGSPDTRFRVTVDHYQVGGLTEFGGVRARPFLTGLLGLTRYEASGDHELRFSASAGGGVKLFPTPRVGIRLDGRVFATLVDADFDTLACTVGTCVGSIDAWIVWQAEFTTALVIRF